MRSTRGLLLERERLGERRSRERVLRLWERGASLHEWEGLWILTWPGERILDSRRAPGALVCASGEGLSATPRASDSCALGSFWVTWHGRTADARASSAEIDPSTWIDVGALERVELSAPRVEPAPLEIVVEPGATRPQEVLGEHGIGMSEDTQRLRDALAPGAPPAGVRAGLARLWSRPRPDAGTPHADLPAALVEPRPAWPSLGSWALSSWLLRLGRRAYARHLRRLVRIFESGDLDAALRHAIPIGGEVGARLRLALRPAPARSELRFTAGVRGSAIPVADRALDVLRGYYQKAYQRLVASGRIEEAAFVMGELLSRPEEAVALLEREGRARAAAELAELRRLRAGLVIRQWMIAGEVDRAVAIARRTGAFHEAVVRLGASHAREARQLRLLWADMLAHHGDFVTAVDVLWPVEEARALASRWIQLGIDLGGEGGARMLVHYASLEPAASEDALARARSLLGDTTLERASERTALAQELLNSKHRVADSGGLRAMASAACRAMARDWELGIGGLPRPRCIALTRLANDPLLRVDLPALRPRPPVATLEQREILVDSTDAGSVAIFDVAPAPRGRLWLALGESGVRLIARDGRPLRHLDVPAFRLVPADTGAHVLTIAPRGEWLHVSRVDVGAQSASPWLDVPQGPFASSFDGGLWFTSDGSAVHALDTLARHRRSLWHLPELSPVLAISRSQDGLMILGGSQHESLWRYVLPALELRSKRELEDFRPCVADSGDGMAPTPAVAQALGSLLWVEPTGDEGTLQILLERPPGRESMGISGESPSQEPLLSPRWGVVPARTASGSTVYVLDVAPRAGWMQIQLPGVRDLRAHLAGDTLLVVDSLGRILSFDLLRGRLRDRLRS